MKKLVKIFLGITVLGTIVYWSYEYMTRTSSLLGIIPENADSIIKIGLHDIKETLVLDALSSPKQYYEQISFSSSDNEDEDLKDSLEIKGVNLRPFNLLLYTVPNVHNTLFGTFAITDKEDFEAHISYRLHREGITIKTTEGSGYKYAISKKQHIAIGWDDEQLVVALSMKITEEKFHSVFSNILVSDKTIKDKNSWLIESLSDNTDHITYIKEKNRIAINFKDGEAIIAGELLIEKPQTFPKETTINEVSEAALQLNFDADFINEENKEMAIEFLNSYEFFKKNNIEPTQIVNRTNGLLNITVAGTTVQTDTIITYDYNEDFEKVEKKSTQEKVVPKIKISLGSEDESLLAYLTKRQAIDNNNIFTPFPFYQLTVKEENLTTSFATFKGKTSIQKKVTANFFNSQINFEKLEEAIPFPQINKYFRSLKSCQINAKQEEGNKVILKGNITGHNTNINLLSQIFFNLTEKKGE